MDITKILAALNAIDTIAATLFDLIDTANMTPEEVEQAYSAFKAKQGAQRERFDSLVEAARQRIKNAGG